MLRNDDGDGLQHAPAKIKPSRVLFGATLFCLRWARENGCEWDTATRDRAAEELGYTDTFGNCCSCTYENIGSCWICC